MGEGNALTVEVQQGVKDFALDLPGTLRHAGHPQPLVDGLGCHDVIARIGVNLPLGHRCAGDGPNPAQEGQDEAQQLQPRVGHASLRRPGWLRDGRCSRWSLQRLSRGFRRWRSRAGEVFCGESCSLRRCWRDSRSGSKSGLALESACEKLWLLPGSGIETPTCWAPQFKAAPPRGQRGRGAAPPGGYRAARWGSRRPRSSRVDPGALGLKGPARVGTT